MRTIILLLLVTVAFAVDSPTEKPLPADLQKELDARDAEIARAQSAFDAAVAKANATAAKKMDALMKTKTKAGDLEGAMAAKALLDKWSAESPNLLGEKTSELASIVMSGYEIDDLKNGARSNSNRNYVWSEIPKELTGLRFIRQAGNATKPISAEVKVSGVVFVGAMDDSIVSADAYLTKAGWKKTGWSFTFDNGKNTRVIVYARSVSAGPIAIASEPFGFGGPILIGNLGGK